MVRVPGCLPACVHAQGEWGLFLLGSWSTFRCRLPLQHIVLLSQGLPRVVSCGVAVRVACCSAGNDYVMARYPWADGTRQCAAGASYGGFMINWINGHDNRFKCLVCHDGATSSSPFCRISNLSGVACWQVCSRRWACTTAARRSSSTRSAFFFKPTCLPSPFLELGSFLTLVASLRSLCVSGRVRPASVQQRDGAPDVREVQPGELRAELGHARARRARVRFGPHHALARACLAHFDGAAAATTAFRSPRASRRSPRCSARSAGPLPLSSFLC